MISASRKGGTWASTEERNAERLELDLRHYQVFGTGEGVYIGWPAFKKPVKIPQNTFFFRSNGAALAHSYGPDPHSR